MVNMRTLHHEGIGGGLRKLVSLTALLALLAVFISSFASAAYAQTSGQGLEISPPLIDKKLDPGTTTVLEIRVRNVTKTRVLAKPSVNDFTAQGEDGQPRIITDETSDDTPFSIKTWVGALPTLDLNPGEAEVAKIPLSVPSNASPGAHFGVIRFTAASPDTDDTGVSLSASIGTLVLANVNGNATVSAEVAEMFVSQNGKQGSMFEYGPLTFTERIKNTGNVYFKPVGNVRVKSLFNREVANLTVNEKRGNVLPGTIRRFEQTLDKKYMFGRYTAEMSVLYGDSNQQLTASVSFWVIPYKLIAAVVLGLVVIFFGIRAVMRGYKRKVIKDLNMKK